MLQKIYSIYSDDLNDVRLFVETGKSHIACWCRKNGDAILRAFEFFQYDAATAQNFEQLIDNAKLYSRLLTMPVAGTVFLWNTDEVICVPNDKNEPAFLLQNFELLKGNLPDTTIFSQPANICTVAWRIKSGNQQIANECFPGALFVHQFIALLPALLPAEENSIYLFFYPYYFTLCLFKNRKLHYINTIEYATPEDVLYFVLNACKQYEVENNVAVHCGGFINESSKLHEALYQYLEGFQLLTPAETQFASDEFKEHPLHYFTPYINYML
jgi:hypothetical protein